VAQELDGQRTTIARRLQPTEPQPKNLRSFRQHHEHTRFCAAYQKAQRVEEQGKPPCLPPLTRDNNSDLEAAVEVLGD
jgi:hypothetical protein